MRCCKVCGCYLPDGVYVCLACGFDENKPPAQSNIRPSLNVPHKPKPVYRESVKHVRTYQGNSWQEVNTEVMWRQDDEGILWEDVVQKIKDMRGNLLGVQVIGRMCINDYSND